MSITLEQLLDEARTHAKRTDEAGLRTAVGRGYYAGYHRALTVSYLCPEPESSSSERNEGVHAALIRRFRSTPKNFLGSKLAQQIGAHLLRCRDLRVTADYELNKTVRAADAASVIHQAEKIQELVARFEEIRASIQSTSQR
jgi:uncharacterized protein (UPF0332 family)